jgi:transposase
MRERGETELPPPNTRRWTIRRKAAVLTAIRSGGLTIEQARDRYALSVEEIRAWERQFERHGLYGLRATRVQAYRRDEC